jgi:predicted GNAT family N-acyltransferase
MLLKKINAKNSKEEVLSLMSLSIDDITDEFKEKIYSYYKNTCDKDSDINKGVIYGVFESGELIAIARLKTCEYSYKSLSIEYVAVKEGFQGHGIGRFLMNELFKKAKEEYDAKLIMLATIDEKEFYVKMNMNVLGKIDDSDYNQTFLYKKL